MATTQVNLETLRINGAAPFWSLSDAADQCLEEAHSILTILSESLRMSEAYGDERTDANGMTQENGLRAIRETFLANALAGVGRLVGVALHCSDAESARRSDRRGQL